MGGPPCERMSSEHKSRMIPQERLVLPRMSRAFQRDLGSHVAFGPWSRRFRGTDDEWIDVCRQFVAHHGPKATWLFMSAAYNAAEILGSQGSPAVGEL